MDLEYTHVAGCLFVQIELLGDAANEITDDAILSNEYLQRFLLWLENVLRPLV